MVEFFRAASLVVVGLILTLVMGRHAKEVSLLLTLAVCVLVSAAAMEFLEPVVDFLGQLRRLGDLGGGGIAILLKAAGIGLLAELAGLICADAGQSALGRALQILSAAAILWLGLPLFQQILTLIEGVLAQV